MAKKFNLAEYIKTEPVSDSDQITMIPWDRIRANEANFYNVDDVDELVNSIQMHGLLEPVIVTPDGDGYLLISGHRRHKAWGILRESDPAKYAEIPAMVRTFESPAMTELALIMANSSTRRLTPAEIGKQAERIERLLYDLKEAGYEFSGRMRDQVAEACKVSGSKLARLKVIREKLAHCWLPRWESGKLPEDTAYKLAQQPDWVQERIFTVNPEPGARGVERVGKAMSGGNDYRCEGLTGPGCGKCTHGDAFLRHDLEDPYSACEGKTCCLECEKAQREWSPCSRACSKAKAKWKTAKDERKAKEDAERDAKQNALHTRIRESAIRLVKAADASGADDDTVIPTRYGRPTVKRLREIAAGGNPGYCYDNFLLPENGLDAASTARALGCSADYVCGLTEDLQHGPYRWTAPVHTDPALVDAELTVSAVTDDPDDEDDVFIRFDWREGNFAPGQDGRYLCTVDLGTGYAEQTCDWRDGQWLCYGRTLDDMFTVVAWWPLPPKMTYRPEAGPEEDDNGAD